MSRVGGWKLVIIAVLVISGAYAWAWAEAYHRSVTCFEQGLLSLEQGDIGLALKGTPPVESGPEAVGGFQQALDVWKHPFAWPKPDVYHQSQRKIEEIITNLDVDTGFGIFMTYFQQDNRLLPEILLRLGEKLEQEGDIRSARDAYSTVIDAFGLDAPEQTQTARQRLESLGH